MATIRLASAVGSTYCGGADGDSRVARTASTLGDQARPGLGLELPRRRSCGDGDQVAHRP